MMISKEMLISEMQWRIRKQKQLIDELTIRAETAEALLEALRETAGVTNQSKV